MKESNDYFESLRREYPEWITKDQFYRIAHISKATALYLLRSGLVPCQDSEKKTRRYKIRTVDVIKYLIYRDIYPDKFRAPALWYKQRSKVKKGHGNSEKLVIPIDQESLQSFRAYLEDVFGPYDDLLTILEVSGFLGYCKETIHSWCVKKRLKSFFVSGKYLIPKICLLDFIASPDCCKISQKPLKHLLLIQNYINNSQN